LTVCSKTARPNERCRIASAFLYCGGPLLTALIRSLTVPFVFHCSVLSRYRNSLPGRASSAKAVREKVSIRDRFRDTIARTNCAAIALSDLLLTIFSAYTSLKHLWLPIHPHGLWRIEIEAQGCGRTLVQSQRLLVDSLAVVDLLASQVKLTCSSAKLPYREGSVR
jgi:hypothetical protein